MRILASLFRDARYAARVLVRSRGFTAIAVLSLALGIGANTAIFSAIDALMLRWLPVDHPAGLVAVVRNFQGRGTADAITYPAFERIRDSGVFLSMAASSIVERSGLRVSGPDGSIESDTARIGLVSGNYFSTLGVRAALGRVLEPADDRADAKGLVAVLSDRYWRQRFNAAPGTVGLTLTLNGTTYTIVGVAAAPFDGEDLDEKTDLWLPIAMQSQVMTEQPGLLSSSTSSWVRAIGRLKPGASAVEAEAAVRTIVDTLPATSAQFGRWRAELAPAGRGFSAEREFFATPLSVLMAVAAVVLLIACANVATLLMVRASARQRELALRLALGAGRGQLIRQMLVESALLTTLAGAVGFLIAVWSTRVLAAIVASGRAPFAIDVDPSVRMLAATGGFSVLTGFICGVLPAFRATRMALAPVLTGAASARPAGILRAGRLLVVLQIAASFVLAIGAGLFVRTLVNLKGQDVGFDRAGVWMFWMAPRESGRRGAALLPLFSAAEERIAGLPGVVSVSSSTDGVLSGFVGLRSVRVDGRVPAPGEDSNAQWNLVGPAFFKTIGMRLVAGREFNAMDTDAAPHVAVVNETMARRFFGEASPIGQRFGFGRDLSKPIEIVGVVRDAKYYSARDDATPMVFLPYQQDVASLFRLCVVVRTATGSPDVVTPIRRALAELDPSVPVRTVTSTGDQLSRSLSEERLTAWLSGIFGALALTLTCIGLYGVMSYSVERRTREIGIRIALGESSASIQRRIRRECLAMAAVGVGIGLPVVLVGTRAVQALLFGVSTTDPVTMISAAVLLAAVAALAAAVPAGRASRVDPIVALRSE